MNKLFLLSMFVLISACVEQPTAKTASTNYAENNLNPFGVYHSEKPYNYRLVLGPEETYQFCEASECFSGKIQPINETDMRLLNFFDHYLALEFEKLAFPNTLDFHIKHRQENPGTWNFWYFSSFVCEETICAGFGSKADRIVFRKANSDLLKSNSSVSKLYALMV